MTQFFRMLRKSSSQCSDSPTVTHGARKSFFFVARRDESTIEHFLASKILSLYCYQYLAGRVFKKLACYLVKTLIQDKVQ